jgi:NAD+ synthase
LKEGYTNVSSSNIDLTSTFDEMKSVLSKGNNVAQEKVDLSLGNTRARLRMTTLYYFAGIKGYLVCGTGNKVEDFGVGFYTKYGDGGVDLSPIADLMKSEVFAVGKYLKVPESILVAKPTDGLFGDSRTDEDQIGASYDELEWAMYRSDEGKTADDFEGREKRVMEIYIWRNKANKHKMDPIPVCEIPKELKT